MGKFNYRNSGGKSRRPGRHTADDTFVCKNCNQPVHDGTGHSGTLNRNHCPYCLHSRHLDLWEPGDRLAACKGVMKPIGLTVKQTLKKYGVQKGELMLVHQCIDCGKISINRIASDDDAGLILEYYEKSMQISDELKGVLHENGVTMLGEDDREFVNDRLFGRNQDLTE